MKKKYLAYLLAAACVLGNGILSYADEGTGEETVQLQETDEEDLPVIGEKSEDAYEVKLTNKTGKEIIGVAIKEIEDEEFSENMLPDEETFADGEERMLFYAPEKEEEAGEETEENSEEKLLEKGYDLELTFGEDDTVVLHAFPFEELEEGEICLEDGIAYITYTRKETEEEISTLEAERMIAGIVPENTDEVVVYDGEETYYEEPSYDNYADPNYGYTEPDYGYQEPVYTEPGGDDGCLGDGLFY